MSNASAHTGTNTKLPSARPSDLSERQHHQHYQGLLATRLDPNPQMFNRSWTLFPSFTLKLWAKLRTNADLQLTKTAKVDYLVSRLEGKVLDKVKAPLDKETDNFNIADVATLLKFLEHLFETQTPPAHPAANSTI